MLLRCALSPIVSEALLTIITLSILISIMYTIYNVYDSAENYLQQPIMQCLNYSWVNNTTLLLYLPCNNNITIEKIYPKPLRILKYENNIKGLSIISKSTFNIEKDTPILIIFPKSYDKVVIKTINNLLVIPKT